MTEMPDVVAASGNPTAAAVSRRMGFWGATAVGVGAIVGGGILALAGAAVATAGRGAVVAFAVNGVIALLTALSMGEMASRFPGGGGTYAFSRRVLSVEAAFAVGWVAWFASIVAGVLYALGFGYFAVVAAGDLCGIAGCSAPGWLSHAAAVPVVAAVATAGLAWAGSRGGGGGGAWLNALKVAVFAVLIAGGLWRAASGGGAGQGSPLIAPEDEAFFVGGLAGLVTAMGYSFIALQGFDLIAAVGGSVRAAGRNVPRAMVASLGVALSIYLPLLAVVVTVGLDAGATPSSMAIDDPEGLIARAAANFLGPVGYALVIGAAVISMFTALAANVMAAGQIAAAMAADRVLPVWMATRNIRGAAAAATWVTAGLVIVLCFSIPDVSAAGAASGLIFLLTFAVAHWLAILMRQRSADGPPPFAVPLFPAVPIVGGLACLALAIFQGVVVPSAGAIAVGWLSIGAVMFLTLFARRARTMDAASLAVDPELIRFRGHVPVMLVPIANPHGADSMIRLAGRLVPAGIGRVMAQTVIVAGEDWTPGHASSSPWLVLDAVLRSSFNRGIRVEVLTTVSSSPMREIENTARVHRCESVLLGLTHIADDADDQPLEGLLGTLDTDVVVLRHGSRDWSDCSRIVVPVAGRGGHDYLLARLLASIAAEREVHFVRVMPTGSTAASRTRAAARLRTFADDNGVATTRCEVVVDDRPLDAVASLVGDDAMLVLGVQRLGARRKLFGSFTRELAHRIDAPMVIISRRG